ncbi:hypothetical protein FRC10_003901 [Ceratobasidium sp. 414]|nr:hypothetical protein FRC10_003901 [Ceratobasidium sp. 414]
MSAQANPLGSDASRCVKVPLKPLNTIWDELSDADFPARPPSGLTGGPAPSNIETISLWGPRYPGQKLHEVLLTPVSPIPEDPATPVLCEPDQADIWDCIVALCSNLRGLIDALPSCDESLPEVHPHGPISGAYLQEVGELFIRSLEPLRPLRPGKLTDVALSRTPELVVHVRELEHRFDDLERVLSLIPVVFTELTHGDCKLAMDKMETILIVLGAGREEP